MDSLSIPQTYNSRAKEQRPLSQPLARTDTSQLEERLAAIVKLIEEKKGERTIVLDAEDSPLPIDYIIITSADNARQLKAIANNIKENMPQEPYGFEGSDSIAWIVMDYGDTLVHIFEHEARKFYDLEGLWGEVIWDSG